MSETTTGADPLRVAPLDSRCSHDEACQLRFERYQRRLRMLALELSQAAEHERRRIAQGLHDEVGQSLAVARLQLGALRRDVKQPDVVTSLDEVVATLGQAIETTRRLTFALRPPLLHELGLEAALGGLTERVHTLHGIVCEFDCESPPAPIATDTAILVHTVVRELLHNVVKHAAAKSARVTTSATGDRLTVEVADDGVGFEPRHDVVPFDSGAGFGLFSARERLIQIGGTLELQSRLNEGTRVLLTVPLASPEIA